MFNADIDECSNRSDECEQFCHNNVGSYSCSCDVGYTLSDDDVSCDGKTSIYLKSTLRSCEKLPNAHYCSHGV